MKSEFCWACTVNAEYTEAKTLCLKPHTHTHTHTGPQCALRLMRTCQEDKSIFAQKGIKMTFGGPCIAAWLPAGVQPGCCWFPPRSTDKSPQHGRVKDGGDQARVKVWLHDGSVRSRGAEMVTASHAKRLWLGQQTSFSLWWKRLGHLQARRAELDLCRWDSAYRDT